MSENSSDNWQWMPVVEQQADHLSPEITQQKETTVKKETVSSGS